MLCCAQHDRLFISHSSFLIDPSYGLHSGSVQSVDEDEKDQFENESRGRNGIDMPGKTSRELAETGFNRLAKVLNQEVFVRVMRLFVLLFAGCLLPVARRFFE